MIDHYDRIVSAPITAYSKRHEAIIRWAAASALRLEQVDPLDEKHILSIFVRYFSGTGQSRCHKHPLGHPIECVDAQVELFTALDLEDGGTRWLTGKKSGATTEDLNKDGTATFYHQVKYTIWDGTCPCHEG